MRSHELAKQLLHAEDMEVLVLINNTGDSVSPDDDLVWPDDQDSGVEEAVQLSIDTDD